MSSTVNMQIKVSNLEALLKHANELTKQNHYSQQSHTTEKPLIKPNNSLNTDTKKRR